jgi:hypothetical protein
MYIVIQKSPHIGKMVSLFTKRALYGHRYIDSTYGRVRPTHGEPSPTHLVLGAHMHL